MAFLPFPEPLLSSSCLTLSHRSSLKQPSCKACFPGKIYWKSSCSADLRLSSRSLSRGICISASKGRKLLVEKKERLILEFQVRARKRVWKVILFHGVECSQRLCSSWAARLLSAHGSGQPRGRASLVTSSRPRNTLFRRSIFAPDPPRLRLTFSKEVAILILGGCWEEVPLLVRFGFALWLHLVFESGGPCLGESLSLALLCSCSCQFSAAVLPRGSFTTLTPPPHFPLHISCRLPRCQGPILQDLMWPKLGLSEMPL